MSKSLDCGDQVDAVLLDFSKAFDKVPHQRLRQKLHYYGVRGQTLDWVTSFLSNRSQRVVCGGSVSAEEDVISGVPQGTVLGLFYLSFISMTCLNWLPVQPDYSLMIACFIIKYPHLRMQ